MASYKSSLDIKINYNYWNIMLCEAGGVVSNVG